MTRSWLYGAVTIVMAHLAWLVLILTQAHADWVMPGIVAMLFIMVNIAGIAAFITALKAPRRPLLLALSMAPLAALLATAGNFLMVAAGTHLDFTGTGGSLGLFAVALGYGLFVAVIGGLIGAWMARRRNAEAAPAVITTSPAEPVAPVEPGTRREPFIGELPTAESRMPLEPTVTSPSPGPDSTANN